MNIGTTTSSTAADLIGRMVHARAFGLAYEALIDYASTLTVADVMVLVYATCASYDLYQLNAADEAGYRRREFVEELAAIVRRSPHAGAYVLPETALAFAFHIATRRAFIAIACQAPWRLDVVFADATFAALAAADSHTYQPVDALRGMMLRDVYWGRDSDEHVAAFLGVGLPPYIAGWHGADYMQTKFNSLSLGPAGRPCIASAADAARRDLLKPANVTVCGKFFEPDPLARERPVLRDGLAVARALRLDNFMAPRLCPHFGISGSRTTPCGRIEHICAAELLICTLEPLRLPPYVLLWIAQLLTHVNGPLVALFVRNVERVYTATNRLRTKRSTRKRVDPAAPAVALIGVQ